MSTNPDMTSNIAGISWNATHDSSGAVRQTIVSNLDAARLERITTECIVEFRLLRAEYEQRVAEKNAEPSVNVTYASYKSSVSQEIQYLFVIVRWVPRGNVADLTNDAINDYIAESAVVEPGK